MTSTTKMPVAFVPHGGGPWPFVELPGFPRDGFDELLAYLRALPSLTTTTAKKKRPRALLVVSAHWEERVPTVMSSARPPMLYDYSGFPPESYRITWPAPGDPVLARHVRDLLERAGFSTNEDGARGYDHGTFVPLKVAYPDANVPVVQLSLVDGLDPAEHIAIGRALAPLRDEGVLIVGSGMTFHNLRAFGDPRAQPIAAAFDAWLQDAMKRAPSERDARLVVLESAPHARLGHPREEHLAPLFVVAGAAGDDVATIPYAATFMGVALSAFHFGT